MFPLRSVILAARNLRFAEPEALPMSTRRPFRPVLPAALAALSLLAACDGPTEPKRATPASIEVTWPTETIRQGETAKVSAVVRDSSGVVISGTKVTWSYADPSILTIDAEGTVHALRYGLSTVTATSGPASVSGTMQVGYPRVVRVDIVPDTVRPSVGTTLVVSVVTADAAGAQVPVGATWRSSDASVVASDGFGGLVAVGPGTARIRASVDAATDSAVVIVGPPVTLAVFPDTAVLLVGDVPRQVAAEVPGPPAKTFDVTAQVSWQSSAPGVAQVDAAGRVTAVSAGEATITATVTSTGLSSSSKVYVLRYQPALDLVDWKTADVDACGLMRDGRAFCTAWTRIYAAAGGPFGSTRPADRCRRAISDTHGSFWTVGRCSRVPLEVDGGHRFASLAVGPGAACAVDGAGDVWCWGAQPERVLGLSGVTSVVSAGSSFCALDAAGLAWCWGSGGLGQLGNGGTASSATPVAVAGGHRFRSLTAATGVVCGVDTDGVAWCWGVNAFGQLGDGTTVNRSSPVQVQTAVRFAGLALGTEVSCGLDAAGKAWCWGARSGAAATPQGGFTPVAAPPTQSFRSLAVRAGLFCGITQASAVVCWGGGVDPSAPNAGPAGSDWAALSTDFDQTCGVTAAGGATCWTSRGASGTWTTADVPRGG
jgi:uncharacterized protein YjdB